MMRNTILFVCALACAVSNQITFAQEHPLKVVVCAGQSNMLGKRSQVDELPARLQGAQRNLIFYEGHWVSLKPGIYQENGFGPEVSFAVELSEMYGEPIGIIKYAVGATSIGEWSPDKRDGLYATLLERVQDARKDRKIEVVGMLWMQGETDAKGGGKNYQKSLLTFIEASRKNFESPSMIFIAGRINPGPSKFKSKDVVRRAIETCPAKHYAWVDCDGLGKVKDDLHYHTDGLVELGNRFAEKFKKMANIRE